MKAKAYHTSVCCPACGFGMYVQMVQSDSRPRLFCVKGGSSWPGGACELYEKPFLAPEYEIELMPVEGAPQ